MDLEALYDEHFEYVWRSLHRLGLSDEGAKDACQEVFLIVARIHHRYDPSRPIRPWLFGIARNVARAMRRTRSHQALPDESPGDDPGTLERLEAAQLVHRALDALPELRREVVILHGLDQVPMREVADALEMPLNSAYSHYRRGFEQLRSTLERLGARP
ncbi:MAG: sigma-70 family RNA polymerase sigma factor [Myxococcota bacterium]